MDRRPKIARRKPSLWGEIALALALTLGALLVLNAGLVGLVMARIQADARIALAEQLASTLSAELAIATTSDAPEAHLRGVLSHFRASDVAIDEMYVIDANGNVLANVRERPASPAIDAGFRQALYGRSAHVEVKGRYSSDARVVVTQPIPPAGPPVAALRISMPLERAQIAGSQWVFLAAFIALSAGIVSLAGYTLFRQRLFRPIRTLKEGTELIASGDFDHRVVLDAAQELMVLTEALNRMASSLADYRTQTQQQLRNLEEANLALERAQDDLVRSARLASVGRLAAGIAHEVGNPLSAVIGYLDLIRQMSDDPAAARDLVDRTSKEVDRIHRTIRDLLGYARPGTGSPTNIDVQRVIEDAFATVRYQPGFREVDVVREFEPRVRPVFVENDKLHQVLVNLMLNAADAMEGKGRLIIRLFDVPDEVQLEIEDSGPGLSREVEKHLFEPFFTTKDPGRGTGLGLATSQVLVERMGGQLGARNVPGGGALFSVHLPAAQDLANEPRADASTLQERGNTGENH
jgi:two-component system, NtrC family, sensor kinase